MYVGAPFKVYIGRPSPLGNKYSVEEFGRDGCIKLFENDLKTALKLTELPADSSYLTGIKNEFKRLVKLYLRHSYLVLECWCAPLACHGSVIKKYIEADLQKLTVVK